MTAKTEGVVLTQAELDRIRAKIQNTAEADGDARRRHLKTLSDERVRHWPNTLEAQRQNKENWKRKQEEEVEAKRREVDRTEAMLQRQLRAETIRRANDKLYEQTGKMKLLRSNLLYAEVIETRKEQIAEELQRHAAEQELRDAYHHEMKRKVAEGDNTEQERALERKEKERAVAEMQQKQLQEFQAGYIAGLKQDKEDGDETQRKARAAIAAEAEELRARKLKGRVEMERMLAVNRNLHEIRAGRISEELAYMEKCKQQRDTLDRAARARKALEAKRFNDRQAIRQKMIDTAAKDLEARSTAHDRKEEREAQEQRRKEDDAAEKKRAAQEKLRRDIDHSRREIIARPTRDPIRLYVDRYTGRLSEFKVLDVLTDDRSWAEHEDEPYARKLNQLPRKRAIQIRHREERRAMQVQEDKQIKAYFKQRTSEMKKLEEEEEAARLTREKQLRASQQKQAHEKRAREMAEQAFENVTHQNMLHAQGEEDARFKTIVQGHIDEFDARCQSTYLLHRTLHHKSPDMFPSGNRKLSTPRAHAPKGSNTEK